MLFSTKIALVVFALAMIPVIGGSQARAALSDYPDWAQEAFCPRNGKCYP